MALRMLEEDEFWPEYTIKAPEEGDVFVEIPDDLIARYEIAQKEFHEIHELLEPYAEELARLWGAKRKAEDEARWNKIVPPR